MPTITIQPNETDGKDTLLYAGVGGGNNYGISTYLQAGVFVGDQLRTLLQFDLSSIPAGAVIVAATLSLTSSGSGSGTSTLELHRALTDWYEGNANAGVTGINGSTWNYRNHIGSVAWGAAGGLAGTDYSSTVIDVKDVTNGAGVKTWNVTTEVDDFVNHGATNRGWWLIAASGETDYIDFRSSGYATAGDRPKLTVDYYDPGVEIHPDSAGKDAYINQGTTGNNWGAAVQVLVGEDSGGSDRVGFLQFDLSSIPADATILEAKLQLTWSAIQNTGQTSNWYRLLVDWTEGTANGAAGTVNWANRMTATAWNSNGARGSGTDRESSASFSIAATGLIVGSKSSIDVTTDVQAWHSGTPNYGWAIDFSLTGGTNNQMGFYSGDSSDVTTRPRLVVSYILQALEGSSSGSSTVTGTLMGSGKLEGSAAGTSSHEAELLTNEYILGQSTGSVTVTGFLGARVFIQGNSFGDSTAIGNIKATYLSQASAAGTSSHVADIKGVFRMEGSAAGVGSLSASPSFQGQMRGTANGVASTQAVGYARARSVARVVGCNPVPLFYITDGSVRPNGQLNILNFLSEGSGYLLKNYKPQLNQYKEGGHFSSSPQSHGRRLRHRVFDNAIDILELTASAIDQDALIQYQQDLLAFQEAAADYWASEYPMLPYYLVARAANETNTRYAIIHMMSCPELENPYEQPFFDIKGATFGGLTLRIERGFWYSTPPGTFDCVEISAQREWTVSGWQSGS